MLWSLPSVQGPQFFYNKRYFAVSNIFDLPVLGFGLGLRPEHYPHILAHNPAVDWFEIISENYMETEGRPKYMLEQIREKYPVVMHGVSLSIGTVDPLNSDYLKKLKELIEWVRPVWISDHLCWTGVAHKQTHDLLPVPYTEEALKHIVQRLREVQDYLERPILMENPSTYLEFQSSEMTEWDFIRHMAEESGCGLLLDANNVYVSCYNHKWDPKTYLDALPMDRVVQIHLAGHQNNGTHIIDTHDDYVTDDVWKLYEYIIGAAGQISTMVEWDDKIPEFDVVKAELDKARAFAARAQKPNDLPQFMPNALVKPAPGSLPPYSPQLHKMQEAILSGDDEKAAPESWVRAKPELSEKEQINIYIRGYRYRLFDIVYDDYTALRHYLGDESFTDLIDDYVGTVPSEYPNLARYTEKFPDFVKSRCDDFACELAVLETAIERVADAGETTALAPEDLAGIDPDTLMGGRLPLRTALSLHAFRYPVNAYYGAVIGGGNSEKPEPSGSYVAVYRHDYDMWRLDLEKKEYEILSELKNGTSVAAALEKILGDKQSEAAEDISRWFARWMNNHLLAKAA